MKKRIVNLLLIAGLSAVCLGGCGKTPEISENGGITHAKSNVEQAIEDVVEKESVNKADGSTADPFAEQGGFYDNVIGTQENGIWIYAEIPKVPETANQFTLQPRDDLNEALLNVFLDSQSGNVQDITQQYLAEQEALLNAPPEEFDAGDGIESTKPVEMAHFGDDSTLMSSDGERTASFFGNTTANYEDESLLQKIRTNYNQEQGKNLTWDRENAEVSFSFEQAQEILQTKLEPLGIAEIKTYEIYYYEVGDSGFYEIKFTPSYDDVGMAHEFGQMNTTDVIPSAMAWVTPNGVAMLNLHEVLGEIIEQTNMGNILKFSQIIEILEVYLENNTLCGCVDAKLTQVEFVYYPEYKETQLVLKPAWHIYVPLSVQMESNDSGYQQMFEKSAAWNIYLDAVTGELLRVE